MKQQFLFMAGLCLSLCGLAQTDTIPKTDAHVDTLHIGTMIIVKKGDPYSGDGTEVHINRRHYYKPSNISTNWVIVDLGFANFNDKTNYSSAAAQQFAPGSTSDWFNLRNGKSVDVNIWLFMQRLNVIKHVVNLKYGLGIELNNYRYTEDIRYQTAPTRVMMDTIHFTKNKLAADYVTVPFMLNFNFTPHRREGFGISVGASAGYLYNSRQKLISREFGKKKTHDNFDLNPWKISWIAEVQLGPVKLYGSYATQSMFKTGLDQTPYTAGIRLSNW
ncbi:MAG TPA: outer membrane beta-barrel protein [Puia sp.]|nr:outer membrane beta-barrel protein [Puia sp.]